MKMNILFLSFLFFFLRVNAQSPFEEAITDVTKIDTPGKLSFNGFVRGSAFGNNGDYQLSSAFAEVSLQNQLNYGKAFLKSDIRIRQGMFFGEEKLIIQPKELYAGFSNNNFDALLGYQIINWGRTDGFNPTNNITPNDYFLLTSEPDDQKESNLILRFKFRITPLIDFEAIGIPFYKASTYRFDLFTMGQNVSFVDDILPEKLLKNGNMAFRLNFDLPAIGFSLSYFDGYDPFHGYDVQTIDWSLGFPVITNVSVPYQKSSYGMDFSIPAGNFIFRGEVAYNKTENPDNKMYIPASDVSYVAGIETMYSGFSVICQYIGKYVSDFNELTEPVLTDPLNKIAQMLYANHKIIYESQQFNRRIFNQQEDLNHAVSLTVMRSFGYDAWTAECSAYYNFTSYDWLIRPKLTWKICDALSAAFGGNYMRGKDNSLFTYTSGILGGVFAEMKVHF